MTAEGTDIVKKARFCAKTETIGRDMDVSDAASSMEVEGEDPVKSPPPLAAADADKCPFSSGDEEATTCSTTPAATDKTEAVFNSKLAFPLSLTHMLESVEGMGLAHIVHWGEHEKSFMICDIDLFVSDVLPKFFK